MEARRGREEKREWDRGMGGERGGTRVDQQKERETLEFEGEGNEWGPDGGRARQIFMHEWNSILLFMASRSHFVPGFSLNEPIDTGASGLAESRRNYDEHGENPHRFLEGIKRADVTPGCKTALQDWSHPLLIPVRVAPTSAQTLPSLGALGASSIKTSRSFPGSIPLPTSPPDSSGQPPELLAGRRSLRPMKGVIVPQLPRARKVPPAAVSGPSPCQERRAAERKTQQRLCQIQAGAGGEREGGGGGMGIPGLRGLQRPKLCGCEF
ncbi:hypothetical protein NQZ68_042218 [Dissostichus eleginoides]|nr:hypothetical protein NQZ68_042218 [Dissostichus eleginoides]